MHVCVQNTKVPCRLLEKHADDRKVLQKLRWLFDHLPRRTIAPGSKVKIRTNTKAQRQTGACLKLCFSARSPCVFVFVAAKHLLFLWMTAEVSLSRFSPMGYRRKRKNSTSTCVSKRPLTLCFSCESCGMRRQIVGWKRVRGNMWGVRTKMSAP